MTGFLRHLASYFFPELKRKRKRDEGDVGDQLHHKKNGPGSLVPVLNDKDDIVGYKVVTKSEPISARIKDEKPLLLGTASSMPSKGNAVLIEEGMNRWDGWPSGDFERDFSWPEFNETKSLMEHWAHEVKGGVRGGDENATDWQLGKRSARACLGVIRCENAKCKVILRPHTKSARLAKQLSGDCQCGEDLVHEPCSAGSNLWKWSQGVHYQHQGEHNHDRPTHILHTSKDEERRFEKLVRAHPTTKALGLQVGVPTVEGPGERVTEISDVFLNSSRVAKERSKIIKGESGETGDGFFNKMSKFQAKYPGLITDINLDDGIVVISIQSKFMRSLSFRGERIRSEPVNGMVNDAAHGWWKEPTSLLMISSTYCDVLNRWAPIVMSYMNGGTIEHYTRHFFAVFRGKILQAEALGKNIAELDSIEYSGTMDFSEAERGGFINAWVLTWTVFRPDPLGRTEAEIRAAGEALLRACNRHFEEQVDRVSNIPEVVEPTLRDHFRNRAKGLVKGADADEFLRRVTALLNEFPLSEPWLGWYRRPSHAAMLFESQRRMEPDIWESIPDTTNAEEAMHWTLYCGFGRKHEFFAGLNALARFTEHLETLHSAKLEEGRLVRYGKPEYHKKIYKYKLTTHPARVKIAKENVRRRTRRNDGRSYDTKLSLRKANERLRAAKAKQKKNSANTPSASTSEAPIPRDPLTLPSFPWKQNSCWLDTLLHILGIVFSGDAFTDLERICSTVAKSGLRASLFEALQQSAALPLDLDPATLRVEKGKIRDRMRRELKSQVLIQDLSSFETLGQWYSESINRENRDDETFRLASLFQSAVIEIHKCSGCDDTGGEHVELTQRPRYQSRITLTDAHHAQYNGSFAEYAREFFALEKELIVTSKCWRTKAGLTLCSGQRADLRDLVISIPAILVARVEDDGEPWDFPATISPESSVENVTYRLVALGLFSEAKRHFHARYVSPGGQHVYQYDGMANMGCPSRIPGATPSTHIYGSNIQLPDDWKVSHVFYYLEGGSETQDQYYEARQQEITASHLLQFTTHSLSAPTMVLFRDQEFKIMPGTDRHWVKNPYRGNEVEYIRRDAPRIPYKRIIATPESEDEDPPSLNVSPVKAEHSLINDAPVSEPSLPPSPAPEEPKCESESPPPRSPAGSSTSLPDSLFELNCRCGLKGDGNVGYVQEDGDAIQCEACNEWMHAACQQGRADIGPRTRFFCERCEPLTTGSTKKDPRRTGLKKTPAERLRVGTAALVRDGTFWYPARLLERKGARNNAKTTYRVKWWRGCSFEAESQNTPDGITLVSEDMIVDSLWHNYEARRQTRLGKWTHAFECPTAEDILTDPSSIPYSPAVAEALQPHVAILRQLLVEPDAVEKESIPAIMWVKATRNSVRTTRDNAPMAWVEASKGNLSTALFVHAGGLSVVERAQVANWVEASICGGDKSLRHAWLMKLTQAHAQTLYLAHRMRAQAGDDFGEAEALSRAWKVLLTAAETDIGHVDVDCEAVTALEKDMFEDSKRAGRAGNQQWGLDAGDHQECWAVYANLPETWRPGDRTVWDEEELERGPNFVEIRLPPAEKDTKTAASRPKPRPKQKTAAARAD